MSTSAIAGSCLNLMGAESGVASGATLDHDLPHGAFAEFLSSLVGVGIKEKTAAAVEEACTKPDAEGVKGCEADKTSGSADTQSENPEDTSSQQVAQVLIAVVQSIPHEPAGGMVSPESAKDEPVREVTEANEASRAVVADREYPGASPGFVTANSEVAPEHDRKPESANSANLGLELPKNSEPKVGSPARKSVHQTQQVAIDLVSLEKVAGPPASDQSSQTLRGIVQPAVEKKMPALESSAQQPSHVPNGSPERLESVKDANVIELFNAARKDKISIQQNVVRREEQLGDRAAFIQAQPTATQAMMADSGESGTPKIKAALHTANDTVASPLGTAQEMHVALDTDLGKVHIRAELGKDDRVSAVVQADHKQTGAILAEQAPALERALAEKDISLSSFQVSDGTANSGQSSYHSTNHRSQFVRFAVASSSGSAEAATHEQDSYESEERRLSVHV